MATLLETWREAAYSTEQNPKDANKFWNAYFEQEKAIYKDILSHPDEPVEGTVRALAKKYDVDILTMTGFLDGINDSLKTPNKIETMKEGSKVSLDYDKESLYWHMVEAKASWLYELPEWDELLTPERRKELYKDQKQSGTVRKEKKIGRNDPCSCGSGKKYKHCCMNKA